ncbi:quinolinate synthase [Candidatus Methanophagaceae archaeon]|jgi:quinolinate synthase|nr:quinolinate synthase [Methanophagales archaeon]
MKKMNTKIIERIERLKRKKNAIVLAHYFERPDVMAVADIVAGSTGLIEETLKANADIIVVCGVDFMAETAAILNPDKKVIAPVQRAVCPLALQLTRKELLEAKKENPGSEVLIYLNSLTETKAVADCICTAANAATIADKMDDSLPILFGPDQAVSYYVRKRTIKELITVPEYGACPVHHKIVREDLINAKVAHPEAKIVAHPECIPEVQDHADYIGSTGGMIKYCTETEADEFLVAAEVGLIHMLQKEAPTKIFYPVTTTAICGGMKKTTVVKIEEALEKEKYEVVVPREIAVDVRRAMERMFELA